MPISQVSSSRSHRTGSAFIPIVAHDRWESDICVRCVSPGRCCSAFRVTDKTGHPPTFWDDAECAPSHSRYVIFKPLHRVGQWTVEHGPDAGRTYSEWLWSCSALSAEGRCTIYQQRPNLCRSYTPLEDGLCAMKPTAEAEGQGA